MRALRKWNLIVEQLAELDLSSSQLQRALLGEGAGGVRDMTLAMQSTGKGITQFSILSIVTCLP
jgi:hypothetical protein